MCPLLALVETHTSTQVLLSGSMQFADESDFYFFSPLLLKNLDGGSIDISKTDSDIMKLIFLWEGRHKLGGTSDRKKSSTGVKVTGESLSDKVKFEGSEG